MKELIEVLTRAANAVAVYYEKEALNPIKAAQRGETDPTKTAAQVIAELPKPRKPRAGKAEAAPASDVNDLGPTTAAAAPTAPAGLSEEDSVKEVRAIAKVYVQRFANQVDGIAAFRKLMSDKLKVAKIDDLVHAQRVQMIAIAKEEIAKADAPTAGSSIGL